MYKKYFKRPLDIICSLLALIILSPVLLVTAILVRIKLGSPVIFAQNRPGKNGIEFRMYKFKTMLPSKSRDGKTITDEERLHIISTVGEDGVLSDVERLTNFGKFLRASSLDELPSLYNVLKGDMSLIGPRPLSTIYLPYYTREEMRRHDVKPGLTGLAQVNGRNAVSWEKKFYYDLQYVDNLTFIGDIRIFLKTISVVISSKDIGQAEAKPESFNIVRERELKEADTTKVREPEL